MDIESDIQKGRSHLRTGPHKIWLQKEEVYGKTEDARPKGRDDKCHQKANHPEAKRRKTAWTPQLLRIDFENVRNKNPPAR
jgi:hypothetical protein